MPACSLIAATTFGWQWPVLATAMPRVKSRYSLPSAVVTVQPEPDTTSRSVTWNQTSLRCEPMRSPRVALHDDDDAARVRAAADGVREPDPRAVDLARPGLAPQLVHELDDLAERRRAERLALRQQPAARVDRAGRRRASVAPSASSFGLLARRAEAELLVREQLAGGVGVLALDHVDVVGPDAGFLVGVVGRERRRRGDVGVVDARERRGLAEHAAREVRPQPRRRERDRVRGRRRSRRRSTIAAAPSFGEHSIQRCSGSHTTRDASTPRR